MKVCVLLPSYGRSEVDYRLYDPPRDLSPWLVGDEVDHLFLDKKTTFRQIRLARRQAYDVYVSLCEGYLDWDVPSVDVIHALDHFDLPYTGPTTRLYDPPKELMKLVATSVGVDVPPFVLAARDAEIAQAAECLRFPLFVKPSAAGDSLGIGPDSLVHTTAQLYAAARRVIEEYDRALIEEFIPGREFTVLLAAPIDGVGEAIAYQPLEFVFPEGETYKSYDLKVRGHHPEANRPCTDFVLADRLRTLARAVFRGFGGVGYARVDVRLGLDGLLYFLEINFTTSVFYPEGYQGSADYILAHDPGGPAGFLRHIISEGLDRHRRRRRKYSIEQGGISGWGMRASEDVAAGELVWAGEGRPHRIISRSVVENTWDAVDREDFRRNAYPLGEGVYVLWDDDPANWATMNHSCDPNAEFVGLDIVARHRAGRRDLARLFDLPGRGYGSVRLPLWRSPMPWHDPGQGRQPPSLRDARPTPRTARGGIDDRAVTPDREGGQPSETFS